MLRRYHESVNQEQNRDVNGLRNFYDEDSELDPNSSEQMGEYLNRAINLIAYVIGPVYRLSVYNFKNYETEMERLTRGLSR